MYTPETENSLALGDINHHNVASNIIRGISGGSDFSGVAGVRLVVFLVSSLGHHQQMILKRQWRTLGGQKGISTPTSTP